MAGALRDPFPNPPNTSSSLTSRSGKAAASLGGIGVLKMDSVQTAITSNNRTLSEIAYLYIYGIAPAMAFFVCPHHDAGPQKVSCLGGSRPHYRPDLNLMSWRLFRY